MVCALCIQASPHFECCRALVRCCAVLCCAVLCCAACSLAWQTACAPAYAFSITNAAGTIAVVLQAFLVGKQCMNMPILALLTLQQCFSVVLCGVACSLAWQPNICTCWYRLPYQCCKSLILQQHSHCISSAAPAQQTSKPFLSWRHCLKTCPLRCTSAKLLSVSWWIRCSGSPRHLPRSVPPVNILVLILI